MRRVECWRQPDGRRSVPGGRGDDRGARCAAARGRLLQRVARGPARSPRQQPAVAPQRRRRLPLRPLDTSWKERRGRSHGALGLGRRLRWDAARVHPAGAVVRRERSDVVLPPTRRRHREEAKGETETMNLRHIVSAAIVCLTAAFPARALTLRCPPDSVKVGNTCVDTYEASLWQIDPANTTLVRKVQSGRVTLADLTAGGAVPLSLSACNAMDFLTNFPRTGNWTPVPGSNPPSPGIYAVSIAGVQPSRCITWF